MARSLEIQIVGNTRDFDNAIDKSTKKTSGFGKSLGGLAKGGAIGAAVGGVALLGKTLFDSVGAAKEAEQAQSRLESALKSANVSYGTHGKAIDEAIQKTSKLAALDDEDLSDAFSKLVRSTGSVTKATEGMNLAADIAAARHISLEAATKTVEKAMLGNEGAFKKVGLAIDKGTSSTEALRLAQEKFGGAAKTQGDTAAGAQAKLQIAFENLQESVGKKLLPVLATLATKLAEGITWAEKNWPRFQEAMEPVMKAVKLVIDDVITKIKAIATTVTAVIDLVRDIKNGEWSKVWGDIKKLAVDGIGGIVTAMLALPLTIVTALGRKAWAKLGDVGGFISDAILGGIGAIGDAISALIVGGVNKAIDLLNKAIDAYNKIPILGDIGHVDHISAPASAGKIGGPPIAGRARGGPVRAGMPYIVGEGGPELMVPGRSGSIVPNGRMAMAGGVTVNLTINGWVGNDQEIAKRIGNEFVRLGRQGNVLGFAR